MHLLDRRGCRILRLTLDHQSEVPLGTLYMQTSQPRDHDGQYLIENAVVGSLCCCNPGMGCQAAEMLAVGRTEGPILSD